MSSPLESIRFEEINSPELGPGIVIPRDRTTPFDLSEGTLYVNPHVYVKEYVNRYIHSASWILLLFGGYLFTRLIALCGFPNDAQHHTWLGHSRNLTDLMLLGFVQAWFAEIVDTPGRWSCIHTSRWFYGLFFGSILAFSVITSIPGFDEAISDDGNESWLFLFILSLLLMGLVWVCVWHVMHAKKTLRTYKDFLGFVVFRAGTLAALITAYILVHNESTIDGIAKFHLHHYFVAWCISLIAAFNHKISLACLAITSGIFVQGIGAYSAAAMFYRGADKPCPEVYYIMQENTYIIIAIVHSFFIFTLIKFRSNEFIVAGITGIVGILGWNLKNVDALNIIDPYILIPLVSIPFLILVTTGTIFLVMIMRRNLRTHARISKKKPKVT